MDYEGDIRQLHDYGFDGVKFDGYVTKRPVSARTSYRAPAGSVLTSSSGCVQLRHAVQHDPVRRVDEPDGQGVRD